MESYKGFFEGICLFNLIYTQVVVAECLVVPLFGVDLPCFCSETRSRSGPWERARPELPPDDDKILL